MALIGPRPLLTWFLPLYDKTQARRHEVRPGITGWAQVRGYRGQTEELWQMEKRVEYDVWYAENWTFFMDLKIIFRTVLNALKGEDNAY